ncbi:MAG: 4-(cytidine 5'-diphospho)-2-C-methyl-D-erythritol kinase [Paludibacteraceae bacterium]|nr:4-(cytidine 5'-diphospho)-2-C-methyl-D-erythritol kinase [Paludibacteraceae bacterium]MBR2936856.1 4-(cytidine 5'-diphospho)-2-C-methyl-D-erythritol kinase [Paludibacteraceae bacterium]
MVFYPNCKINIGLRVVRKREDGYHDLETIFYPVYGLHDELEVEKAEKFAFLQDGLVVDCLPTDNLIVKVYKRMQAHFPQIGNVKITFKKNIPFGAGLGGGSSDAAHMAIALNEIFQLGLTKEQLAEEVRPLGADCPFFIYNTPCYAEGIGDKLTPISLNLSNLRLVMIKPNCSVSTREAYSGIICHPEVAGQIKQALNEGLSLDVMRPLLINDFEKTVFPLHPEIAKIKKCLRDAGAIYAAMSGSGSTVFGLFQNDTEGSTYPQLRLLHEEFSSMVILDNTLA